MKGFWKRRFMTDRTKTNCLSAENKKQPPRRSRLPFFFCSCFEMYQEVKEGKETRLLDPIFSVADENKPLITLDSYTLLFFGTSMQINQGCPSLLLWCSQGLPFLLSEMSSSYISIKRGLRLLPLLCLPSKKQHLHRMVPHRNNHRPPKNTTHYHNHRYFYPMYSTQLTSVSCALHNTPSHLTPHWPSPLCEQLL